MFREMDFPEVFKNISAGLLVTDADFRIIWVNSFEEDFYQLTLEQLCGRWVVDCHKEENRQKIRDFLQEFKSGERKELAKSASGMVVTYNSYFDEAGKFAGIVRTRMKKDIP